MANPPLQLVSPQPIDQSLSVFAGNVPELRLPVLIQTAFPGAGGNGMQLQWNNGGGCYTTSCRFAFHSVKVPLDGTFRFGDAIDWEFDRGSCGMQLFATANSRINFLFKPATSYRPIFTFGGGCWMGNAVMFLPVCDDPDFVPVGIAVRKIGYPDPQPGDYCLMNKYFLWNEGTVANADIMSCFNLNASSVDFMCYRPFPGYTNLMVCTKTRGLVGDHATDNSNYDTIANINKYHNYRLRPIARVAQDYLSGKIPMTANTTINFIKTVITLPKDILNEGFFYAACHQGGPPGTQTSVCETMVNNYCKDSLHANEEVCGCVNATKENTDLTRFTPLTSTSMPIYCLSSKCTDDPEQDVDIFKKNIQMTTCPPINDININNTISGSNNVVTIDQMVQQAVNSPGSSGSNTPQGVSVDSSGKTIKTTNTGSGNNLVDKNAKTGEDGSISKMFSSMTTKTWIILFVVIVLLYFALFDKKKEQEGPMQPMPMQPMPMQPMQQQSMPMQQRSMQPMQQQSMPMQPMQQQSMPMQQQPMPMVR